MRSIRPRLAVTLAVLAAIATPAAAEAAPGTWESLGPEGGTAFQIEAAPGAPGVAYVATGNGVWRTADAGASWSFTGGAHLFFEHVAVDQGDPARLYAAAHSGGWTTADGGVTWTRLGAPVGTHRSLTAIAASPEAPGTLYASAHRRLWKSADGGATWTELSLGFPVPVAGVSSFAFRPGRPDVVFAAGVLGVYRTVDGGATWTRRSRGIESASTIAYAPGGETLYASAVRPPVCGDRGNEGWCSWTSAERLMKSGDGGRTWTRIEGIGTDSVWGLRVTASALVVAAGGQVHRSPDGGATWTHAPLPPATNPYLDGGTFAVDAGDDARLYVGGYVGAVQTSADGGATWAPATDIRALVLAAVAVDPADPTTVHIGAWDGGIRTSRDAGATWEAARMPRKFVLDVATGPATSGSVFALTFFGVFASADAGATFRQVKGTRFADAIAPHPRRADTVFTATLARGGSVVVRARVGEDPVRLGRPVPDGYVSLLETDPTTGKVLYAAGGNRLRRSDDGGVTWTHADAGLRGRVTALAVAPSDPRVVYAGTPDALFVSHNRGRSWQQAAAAHLPRWVSAVAVDPADADDAWVASNAPYAVAGGVYHTADGGATFAEANTGLPVGTWVGGLALAGPRLYAAVYGGSAWALDKP